MKFDRATAEPEVLRMLDDWNEEARYWSERRRHPNSTVVIIRDRSMEPEFLKGDGLLIDPDIEPGPADPVAARVEGEVVVGYFHRLKDNTLWLTRGAFPPFKITANDRIVGVVVYVQRYIRRLSLQERQVLKNPGARS